MRGGTMLCALIMAGGKGTRFWPLSTEKKPKQFLNLLGKDTMIQMTVNRIKDLIPMNRIFVVTSKEYVELVKEQLPELPVDNIIVEPMGKNTAPCIALSAFYINKRVQDATIAVLPSDHLILDDKKFRETLAIADKFVDKNNDAIVTIGMKPDRAETGYGYIKLKIDNGQWIVREQLNNKKQENESNRQISKNDIQSIYKVEKFVEKPDKETAEKYLKDGNYLWNGGMFIWKAITILKLTKMYLKNTFNVLSEVAAAVDEEYEAVLQKNYENVDSISVDYGIMEKADNIYVIPGDFGWDDVGTWNAVLRYRKKDCNDNIFMGDKIINIDGKNNIAVSNGKPIIIAGINDAFVVESDEAIVVTRKESIGDVKGLKKFCTN